MTSSAMKVVTIAIGACAKLTIRVERQISTRASANAAYPTAQREPAKCCVQELLHDFSLFSVRFMSGQNPR